MIIRLRSVANKMVLAPYNPWIFSICWESETCENVIKLEKFCLYFYALIAGNSHRCNCWGSYMQQCTLAHVRQPTAVSKSTAIPRFASEKWLLDQTLQKMTLHLFTNFCNQFKTNMLVFHGGFCNCESFYDVALRHNRNKIVKIGTKPSSNEITSTTYSVKNCSHTREGILLMQKLLEAILSLFQWWN